VRKQIGNEREREREGGRERERGREGEGERERADMARGDEAIFLSRYPKNIQNGREKNPQVFNLLQD